MGMLRVISKRGDDCVDWNEPDAMAGHTEAVAAIREEGGKRYVDLTLSTTNQDGKEVASGSATALIDA